MGRRLGVLTALAVFVLAMPGAALAVPPDHLANQYTGSFVLDDFCSFPVTVSFGQSGTEIDRYDTAGNWIGMEVTVTEQDTYTAARTLVSEPYRFHVAMRFDANGDPVQYNYSGLLIRFQLPDRSQFILAGMAAFPNETSWIVVPDRGRTSDFDALCAALAG